LLSLTRAGYLATSSPFEQHHLFAYWVRDNLPRFGFLEDGERIAGEWLAQAHGTRYNLPHEPFVPFDIMRGDDRTPYKEFLYKVQRNGFTVPNLVSYGQAISIKEVMKRLRRSGHGAVDQVEGAVWRVEKNGEFLFICKYVRPDKVDGCFMDQEIWNWRPKNETKTKTQNFLIRYGGIG